MWVNMFVPSLSSCHSAPGRADHHGSTRTCTVIASAEPKKQTGLLPDVDPVGSGMRLVLRCPGQRLQSDGFNFPATSDSELGGDLHITSLANEWSIQHFGSPQHSNRHDQYSDS
jgi:hypothetical protein